MSTQVVTKSVAVVSGEGSGSGTIDVACFSKEARLKRAAKTGAICLAIALVCAGIPGAHFVLVPSMLVLTPFLVLRTYRVMSLIENVNATCAVCGGALTSLSSKEKYPLYERCLSCQRENRLTLAG
jgi:tRNA(Ile2) C34 agmatinyltransferase TiaS